MQKPDITFTKRSVLTDARFDALIAKFGSVYKALTEELGEDEDIVDRALTKYARLASQAINPGDIFPLPGDSVPLIKEKALRYFALNPAWVDAWEREVVKSDSVWNVPELTPRPPELDADEKKEDA